MHQALAGRTDVTSAFYLNGWPNDPTAFDNADAILLYMNGGNGHAAIQGDRLKQLEPLMKRGVGLVCAHYGVEVPKEKGGTEWLRRPTLIPALAVGIVTVAVPMLILQPGMGAGIAARRTPRPNAARLQSLVTHAVFGGGLYVSGWVARSVFLA